MTDHPLMTTYNLDQMENMWVTLVLDVIAELLEKQEVCDCQDCVLDLLALALNQLPPNYWVSGKFNAFTPPESFLAHHDNRKKARDIVLASLDLVKKNPHH